MNHSPYFHCTLGLASLIKTAGWSVSAASIYFAGEGRAQFCACFAILVVGSVVYLLTGSASRNSKRVRSSFIPFLIGASVWFCFYAVMLFLQLA